MTAGLLTGGAQRAVEALGDRARLCDLYDEVGSAIYHDITLGDDSEVREVLALLRSLPDGPVLELAAGAGRMALPIAASGRAVTALDRSPALLGLLTARLDELVEHARRRVEVAESDMAHFELGRLFAVIALGSTSITLLDPAQRQSLYACVRRHLSPGGAFVVTVPVPVESVSDVEDIHRLAVGWSGEEYDMFDTVTPGNDHRCVTVIPRRTTGARVPVAVSRPRLFDGSVVGRELRDLGFALLGEVPLGDCTERLDALVQVWGVAS
jgi:SAM-dependent methyltransferase